MSATISTIHLRDALRIMEEKDPEGQPIHFSYKGYTHNRKTSRGGEEVEIPEAVLLTEAALANPRSMRQRIQDKAVRASALGVKHRPGAHYRNSTRDLLLPTGDKHRIIIWLMTEINGMRVVL